MGVNPYYTAIELLREDGCFPVLILSRDDIYYMFEDGLNKEYDRKLDKVVKSISDDDLTEAANLIGDYLVENSQYWDILGDYMWDLIKDKMRLQED